MREDLKSDSHQGTYGVTPCEPVQQTGSRVKDGVYHTVTSLRCLPAGISPERVNASRNGPINTKPQVTINPAVLTSDTQTGGNHPPEQNHSYGSLNPFSGIAIYGRTDATLYIVKHVW